MTVGKLPVENFLIETIYDANDKRLLEFRKEIFQNDLLLNTDLIDINKPHSWWLSNFDKKIAEDAYKYSTKKWNSINFNCIESIIDNDKIVGISGCKLYGKYLRTSLHLYLLKRVRNKYPGIKYLKNGFFNRHINYALKNNCDGLFFTVYPYSKKLEGLIKNHTTRTISLVDKSHLLYINEIKNVGEYVFNEVNQTFFYYPLSSKKFDVDEVLYGHKRNIFKQ